MILNDSFIETMVVDKTVETEEDLIEEYVATGSWNFIFNILQKKSERNVIATIEAKLNYFFGSRWSVRLARIAITTQPAGSRMFVRSFSGDWCARSFCCCTGRDRSSNLYMHNVIQYKWDKIQKVALIKPLWNLRDWGIVAYVIVSILDILWIYYELRVYNKYNLFTIYRVIELIK